MEGTKTSYFYNLRKKAYVLKKNMFGEVLFTVNKTNCIVKDLSRRKIIKKKATCYHNLPFLLNQTEESHSTQTRQPSFGSLLPGKFSALNL